MRGEAMTRLSTLCYIERDGKYLMLHRTVKKKDVNKDKWIGVGGHFEKNESPEECLLREVWEETGYTLTSWQYRGIVTFIYGEDTTEYMSLYTADGFTGEPHPCSEGQLEWVDKEEVLCLNIWEGDKIFFRLLNEGRPFFSLKLVYDRTDTLLEAALDGKPLELFDILNEDGTRTGLVRERGVAHLEGSLHPTAHVWIVREKEGGWDLLLQKRSACKDSNPGRWEVSCGGHVTAGDDYLPSAIRELTEELGIRACKEELHFVGMCRAQFEDVFYGRPFRDNELSAVYIYREPVDETALILQESEVEAVRWMDYRECWRQMEEDTLPNCMYLNELKMVGDFLFGEKVRCSI